MISTGSADSCRQTFFSERFILVILSEAKNLLLPEERSFVAALLRMTTKCHSERFILVILSEAKNLLPPEERSFVATLLRMTGAAPLLRMTT